MNPWHYDLAEMEAVTNGGSMAELREYCVSAVREFHTGGLRFAVYLAAYEEPMQDRPRVTTAQLLYLYRQLVHNDHMRRTVALEWLRRQYPEDAKSELQRIVPHSDHWFSIVDRVEPHLGAIARINIEASGGVDGCSACGDPAEDYLIVNGAEAMPGVPSLRLCADCVGIAAAMARSSHRWAIDCYRPWRCSALAGRQGVHWRPIRRRGRRRRPRQPTRSSASARSATAEARR